MSSLFVSRSSLGDDITTEGTLWSHKEHGEGCATRLLAQCVQRYTLIQLQFLTAHVNMKPAKRPQNGCNAFPQPR